MSTTSSGGSATGASSKEIFSKATPAIQQLVRAILQDEREVMHMSTRTRIHEKILERVKKAIS